MDFLGEVVSKAADLKDKPPSSTAKRQRWAIAVLTILHFQRFDTLDSREKNICLANLKWPVALAWQYSHKLDQVRFCLQYKKGPLIGKYGLFLASEARNMHVSWEDHLSRGVCSNRKGGDGEPKPARKKAKAADGDESAKPPVKRQRKAKASKAEGICSEAAPCGRSSNWRAETCNEPSAWSYALTYWIFKFCAVIRMPSLVAIRLS